MHAFVTSVQLMNAADELLPLTPDGQPALPPNTRAGRQVEVHAMILRLTAYHIAPDLLEWEGRQQDRISRYIQRRMALAGDSWEAAYPPAMQPLGGLLLKLLHIQSHVQFFQLASAVAQEACSAHNTISRQLQQAQRCIGQQILTADQLEAACHRLAIMGASEVLASYASQQTPPAEHGGLEAVVPLAAAMLAIGSSERLLALENNSPRSLLTAGMALVYAAANSPSSMQQLLQRAAGCFMSALRAAEAARSPYWIAHVASFALPVAIGPMTTVSHADLAALVAAAEGVPAAVKQLSPVLPQMWVANLKYHASQAAATLPAARARLQGGMAFESAQQALADVAARNAPTCTCSGCGQRALGLQRCARCKQAACEWGARGRGCVSCAAALQGRFRAMAR